MNITIGKKYETKHYSFRETCFGICEKNNQIAIMMDKYNYSLIGGGIEKGETKEEALCREFFEEVGAKINIVKKICTIDCFWFARGIWPTESLTNIYIVDILSCENNNAESKIEYVDINKVIELLPLPYHKKAVEIFIKKRKRKNK